MGRLEIAYVWSGRVESGNGGNWCRIGGRVRVEEWEERSGRGVSREWNGKGGIGGCYIWV